MEPRPGVLAVGAGAAPEAVGAEADLGDAVHGVGGDQAALPDGVGGQRRFAEQHEAIQGEVHHAAQAVAGMQVVDLHLDARVVATVMTAVFHGGSSVGSRAAAGEALQDPVDGAQRPVHQRYVVFGGDDACVAALHVLCQLGDRLDRHALAAVVDEHVVAGRRAVPGQLQRAALAVLDELEPGVELQAFQLLDQRLRAG